jgi:DNA-binding CsgD family transcriptional regulator
MKRIEREGPIAFTFAVMTEKQKKAVSNEKTNRETEVIRLISLGFVNKEIADTLQISIKTVEKHRGNAMQKLKLRAKHRPAPVLTIKETKNPALSGKSALFDGIRKLKAPSSVAATSSTATELGDTWKAT